MLTRVPAFLAAAGALLALSGCEQPQSPSAGAAPSPPEAQTGTDYALPPFVGRIWMSTTFGRPRGSIRIFLPDKTLLMDSCFETYRIAEWGVISEDTIRWREDVVPIEARYVQPTKDSLRLKIKGQDEEETYVAADVPFVCPDMPR